MGLKLLKSGKFRIRDQVFFIPNQDLFCYATQPSIYVTVKQTDKKEDEEDGTDVSCESRTWIFKRAI